MTISRSGLSKLSQAKRRGWRPTMLIGPCRFLREHRDHARQKRKGGRP
jgi:hypothetical protein